MWFLKRDEFHNSRNFNVFTKKWGVKLSKKARDFSGSSSHRSLKSFEFSPPHFFDSELCTFYNPVQWHCTMAEKRSSNSRNIETFFFSRNQNLRRRGRASFYSKILVSCSANQRENGSLVRSVQLSRDLFSSSLRENKVLSQWIRRNFLFENRIRATDRNLIIFIS